MWVFWTLIKMGMSAVQYKIMPNSLDVDLTLLAEESKKIISKFGGIVSEVEEQSIAFGLKALIISFAFSEGNEIDVVGNSLSDLEGVSSVDMIDYRRALG